MLYKDYGSSNGNEKTHLTSKMYHKEMFLQHVWRPFYEAFSGVFEHATAKLAVLLGGLPALLALDLFVTPSLWWKGLLYLVVADWIGGVVNAIYRDNFNWNICVRKWYQATGYLLVCGGASILSNGFPEIFYYFQFVVYATFFLKEFVSLLRTFRLLTMVEVMWDMVTKGGINLEGFKNFSNEVERRHEKDMADHDKKINMSNPVRDG